MINISNKSDSLVIVIHEIYGVNAHMKQACANLSEQGYDVICPNLLKRAGAFKQEEENIAYDYFMKQVGFEEAVVQMKMLIEEKSHQYKRIYLVGFSIGATIAWLCSEMSQLVGIVGYYGSRIRDYLPIVPTCPVLLFFPEEEKSFQMEYLLSKLAEKKIHFIRMNATHGWMNPYDPAYNESKAQQAAVEMEGFLLSISRNERI